MLITFMFACLAAVAKCQHLPKLGRLPGISNSLVNFGKMDISLHFNTGGAGSSDHAHAQGRVPDIFSGLPATPSSFFGPSIVSESSGICPCMRNAMRENQRSNPIEMINKILMSNNLFTNSKEPISSSLCCGNSMEQFEKTVIKPQTQNFPSILPNLSVPSSFNLYQPPSLPKFPAKSKSFELLLYPNKKDNIYKFFPKKNKQIHDRIHPVGDRDLRKGMSNLNFNLRAFPPLNSNTSVKKDLNIQEKVEVAKIEEEPAKDVEVATTKDAGPINEVEPTKDAKEVTTKTV